MMKVLIQLAVTFSCCNPSLTRSLTMLGISNLISQGLIVAEDRMVNVISF